MESLASLKEALTPDDIPAHDDASTVATNTNQAQESDVPEWKVDNDYSHYRPLDHSRKEIRLATISAGVFDDPIHCKLTRHELLSDDLGFEALSYCWGDLKDTDTIFLCHDYFSGDAPSARDPESDEKIFNVTKTLARALRYLRHTDKERTIWIDALCINQGSIKERNYAVSFMADVYRHASSVTIFLGEEGTTQHFRGLWDLMGMLKGAVERSGTKPLWQHADIGAALEEIKITPKTEGPSSDESMFRAHMGLIFNEFFKYPWFKRVWVVQEAMNAKEAVVYCGNRQTDWRDILVMLCWAVKSSRSYSGGFAASLDLRDRLPPFLWTTLHASKRGQIDAPARMPLLDIISRGRAFGATDPRDKVFALLSFGEGTSDLTKLPPRLKPDYGKSASDVWRDLTRQWIIDHKSLDILSILREEVDKNNQIAERTVFVSAADDPDLPESRPSGPIEKPPTGHPSWGLWHAQHPESAGWALFNVPNEIAHSSYPLDLDRLDKPADPAVLSLPGSVLDTVLKVQWTFKRWTYSDQDIRQFNYNTKPPTSVKSGVEIAWASLIGGKKGVGDDTVKQLRFDTGEITITPYPDGRSRLQAFIETLICRCLNKRYFYPGQKMSLDPEDTEGLEDSEREDLQIIADFAAHWAKGVDGKMQWFPQEWAGVLKPLARHGSSRSFTERCGFIEGRCFFQCGGGAFGLCPRGTQAGDVVASLAGGRTPFVLRRTSEGTACWMLVGDCYIHNVDVKRMTRARVDSGDELKCFDIE